jgi:hypothetical protein
MLYEEERPFFVSEYERLNPFTREEGIRNFYQFMLSRKDHFQNQLVERGRSLVHNIMEEANSVADVSRLVLDYGSQLTNNFRWTEGILRKLVVVGQEKQRNKFRSDLLHIRHRLEKDE